MVIDHKDTNKCNNRPENPLWVTRLENALNNPITRNKIKYLCGSIEVFLKIPPFCVNQHQTPIPVGYVLYQKKKQQNALKILKDGQRKITLPQNH